ncbi:MAG: hypothetical protein AAGE52_05525 [Myxococcota bacterium]
MTYRTFFFATILACSSGTSIPDGGAPDARNDSATECTGCVSGGACEPGTLESACGSGGASCTTCGTGESCVDAMCVAISDCESTCDGCCDGDVCLPGGDEASCGSAGLACRACEPGETCEDGGCVPPCEATCAGCCTAAGECQTGTADAACGALGSACTDCGAGRCDAGMCVDPSCAESCDGCCSGDTCLAGDSSSACGIEGGACLDCGPSFTCGGGSCAVDGASRWDVLVARAMVPTRDWADRAWDAFGGLPDVYVRLTAMDGTDELRANSSTIDNDESPAWSDEVVFDAAPARALRAGVEVAIIDRDTAFDQTMGSCRWTPSDAEFVAGFATVTCAARAADDPNGPAVEATVVLRLARD